MPKSDFIPDAVIAEVRARADIAQIIGETVTLKRVGTRLVGLCPFHKDMQPSFYVNPDRGAFKCFGCGIGGDVFRFLMETQRLAFPEAVRFLAERLNIEIPAAGGPSRPRGYRERLFAINDAALAFYREMLAHPEIGKAAREYLRQRDCPRSMMETFEIGYAPDGWERLVQHLQKRALSLQDALAVGVIAQREQGEGYYDRYRNRLVFPVRNPAGKVVAFSARLLAGDGPKYINSPESDIFSKSRTFFGIHLATKAISQRDQVLICEGNFDVVSLHQFGFTNAVAALGTAFTENHAALLERYTKNVVFVFDGDAAGQKAMARLIDIYLPREFQPRAVVLPPSEDPDSFLKKNGADAMKDRIEKAPPLLDFVIDGYFRQSGPGEDGLVRAMNAACALAARITNPIQRGLLAKTLSARARLPEETIRQQIDRARRGRHAPAVSPVKTVARQLPSSEWTILATLLHFPGVRGGFDPENLLLALPDGFLRTLGERLLEAPADQSALGSETLMRAEDPDELRNLAGDLLMTAPPCEAKVASQMIRDALQDRERRKLQEEIDALSQELEQARTTGNQARIDDLERRIFALRKTLKMIRF
ncbi:MAG: DNA primase [Myxococcales bacterium]|nr:DNA primase [Myxococcales bacterium]